MSNETTTQTLSAIVAQLKSYGYYSLAKGIQDQTGISSVDAGNQLQDLVEKHRKETPDEDLHQLEAASNYIVGLQFNEKKSKINPNYRSTFNTQHRGFARAAAFSADGNFIATGSEDTSLKVLDAAVIRDHRSGVDDKKVLKTLYDHTAAVNEVAFHPNGAVLASCSDDCMIKFYDLQRQNTKKGFRYLSDVYPVKSIAFHPSGEFIISGTDHHAVRLFDITSMKVFVPTDHHLGAITKVRYAPNGATFASCSVDGSIKIYDTVTSKCVNTISKAHGGSSVIGITYSKSCAYLLSTGLDSTGKLWDLTSGKVICVYKGALQKFDHAPMVFSYNEDYIIGQDSATHAIVIWDSQTGEIMRQLKSVHESTIHTITASPNDSGFMSVGDDCRGRYWNVM